MFGMCGERRYRSSATTFPPNFEPPENIVSDERGDQLAQCFYRLAGRGRPGRWFRDQIDRPARPARASSFQFSLK